MLLMMTITVPNLAFAFEDPRNMRAGTLPIVTNGTYIDVPSCAEIPNFSQSMLSPQSSSSRLVCVFARHFAPGELSGGEHIQAVTSDDWGATWSRTPTFLEPDPLAFPNACPQVLYVPPPIDRVYVWYIANTQNIRRLPNGQLLERDEFLGEFRMRWSDTRGDTWSTEYTTISTPTTWIDLQNPFRGRVQMFWTVDQPKVGVNGTVYFAFTKTACPPLEPPQEFFLMASANLLSEHDPHRVVWQMLPFPPPHSSSSSSTTTTTTTADAAASTWRGVGADVSGAYLQEPHVQPLQRGGFYMQGRAADGFLQVFGTPDVYGVTSWSNRMHAQYFFYDGWTDTFLPQCWLRGFRDVRVGLKHTMGPSALRRLETRRDPVTGNVPYLVLFYNTYGNVVSGSVRNPLFASVGWETGGGTVCVGRALADEISRNGDGISSSCPPILLSEDKEEDGEEVCFIAPVPTIVWSQPEVVLYGHEQDDDNNKEEEGMHMFALHYADIVEDASTGNVHVIRAQTHDKREVRFSTLSRTLIDGLVAQHLHHKMPLPPQTTSDGGDDDGDDARGFSVLFAVGPPPSPPLQTQSSSSFSSSPSSSLVPMARPSATLLPTVNINVTMTTVVQSPSRIVFSCTYRWENDVGGVGEKEDGDNMLCGELTLDPICTQVLLSPSQQHSAATNADISNNKTKDNHSVVLTVDFDARIMMAVVDGMLCDGAGVSERGWAWIPPFPIPLEKSTAIAVFVDTTGEGKEEEKEEKEGKDHVVSSKREIQAVRVWRNRPLRVSEAVAAQRNLSTNTPMFPPPPPLIVAQPPTTASSACDITCLTVIYLAGVTLLFVVYFALVFYLDEKECEKDRSAPCATAAATAANLECREWTSVSTGGSGGSGGDSLGVDDDDDDDDGIYIEF